MLTMPNPYPMEFRRDVVQVARNREPGVTLEKIAADFGIHPITLSTWVKKADIDDGVKPGLTSGDNVKALVNIGPVPRGSTRIT